MALQSQSDRSVELGQASYTYRPGSGKGSKAPLLLAGLIVAAAAGVGIWYVATKPANPGTPANSPESGKPLAGTNKTPDKNSSGTSSPRPEVNPTPVTIAMGGAQPGTAPTTPAPAATPGAIPAVSPAPAKEPATSPPGIANPPAKQTPAPGDTGKPGPTDVTTPGGNPPTPSGGNPTATPPGPGNVIQPTGSTGDMMSLIAEGDRKARSNDLVGARAAYSKALANPKTAKSDQESLRSKMTTINQDLIFSPKIHAGDPMVEEYIVESGDGLQKIARKRNLVTDWRLIERVNKADSSRLKVGQKLKLVRGPFHAVVRKSDYRLDLFWGAPKSPEDWVYVRSIKVGLGEKTPTGEFTLKPGSKQIDPPWTNPVTGERFAADNAKNPIGEHWIGIQGEGDASKYKGFGLHGTIEPDSIGQSKSMGCVRMLADDVALVYELLMDPMSVVKIEP
ncbi:MAG: L,D-transpeptidase family protein [Planctomycetota bacterium]